ncbi:hypothetical protein B0H10DRAFT_1939298 [Mycena sp. CBHHK59/15]|nr:hypothetical protein B0H10DRAFT_1939298 [Mycena sp. CBHHK59/15]
MKCSKSQECLSLEPADTEMIRAECCYWKGESKEDKRDRGSGGRARLLRLLCSMESASRTWKWPERCGTVTHQEVRHIRFKYDTSAALDPKCGTPSMCRRWCDLHLSEKVRHTTFSRRAVRVQRHQFFLSLETEAPDQPVVSTSTAHQINNYNMSMPLYETSYAPGSATHDPFGPHNFSQFRDFDFFFHQDFGAPTFNNAAAEFQHLGVMSSDDMVFDYGSFTANTIPEAASLLIPEQPSSPSSLWPQLPPAPLSSPPLTAAAPVAERIDQSALTVTKKRKVWDEVDIANIIPTNLKQAQRLPKCRDE